MRAVVLFALFNSMKYADHVLLMTKVEREREREEEEFSILDFHSSSGCVLACREGIDAVFQWVCTYGDLLGIGMSAKRRIKTKF